MDKASASGAGDSRLESWAGHIAGDHEAHIGPMLTLQRLAFQYKYTRGGTRTRNLLLRREAPYPLGHTSWCCLLSEQRQISMQKFRLSMQRKP